MIYTKWLFHTTKHHNSQVTTNLGFWGKGSAKAEEWLRKGFCSSFKHKYELAPKHEQIRTLKSAFI